MAKYTGPVAYPENKSGDVCHPVKIPSGGTAHTGGLTTAVGGRANGQRASDGKSAPSGGLGFDGAGNMAASMGTMRTGYEGRSMPKRSDHMNADKMASDVTGSTPPTKAT